MDSLVPDQPSDALPKPARSETSPLSTGPVPELSVLIQAVGRHDRRAFTILFSEFAPRIKTYLLRRGLQNAQAEDLAQDALLAVWRKAALFQPSHTSAQAWLFTITRNLLIDHGRRQRRAGDLQGYQPLPVPLSDAILEAADSARQVHAALATLRPEQVEAIKLSFFDDYSHARVEAALGVPLGTVKSRIRQAILKMRAILGNER
jgi:RNA polymerase sigma-70 factor (ECF subfamily)